MAEQAAPRRKQQEPPLTAREVDKVRIGRARGQPRRVRDSAWEAARPEHEGQAVDRNLAELGLLREEVVEHGLVGAPDEDVFTLLHHDVPVLDERLEVAMVEEAARRNECARVERVAGSDIVGVEPLQRGEVEEGDRAEFLVAALVLDHEVGV